MVIYPPVSDRGVLAEVQNPLRSRLRTPELMVRGGVALVTVPPAPARNVSMSVMAPLRNTLSRGRSSWESVQATPLKFLVLAFGWASVGLRGSACHQFIVHTSLGHKVAAGSFVY